MKTKIPAWSIGIGVLVVLAVVGAAMLRRTTGGGPPIQGSVAAFTVATPSGPPITTGFLDSTDRHVTLADFKGRYVLVNLWATWCPPCVKEMPSLARFKAAHDGPNFTVLTVSVDKDGRAKVDEFLKAHDLAALPADLDPGLEFATAARVVGFPTTLLIGPDGSEIGRIENSVDWTSPDAAALIDWYLKPKS